MIAPNFDSQSKRKLILPKELVSGIKLVDEKSTVPILMKFSEELVK